MSDRLSAARPTRAAVAWAAGILVVFVVVGVLAGLLWRSRVDVPTGVVVSHQWFPDPFTSGEQASFAATGWFVTIALVAAFVLGVLAAWLSRAPEVLTLLAVLVGSLLAAWVMRAVGLHGAPADPQTAAAHAADGTRLSGTIGRPGVAAFVTWPLAAVVPLGAIYLLFAPRGVVESENDVLV